MAANRPIKSDQTLFAIIDAIRERDGAGVTELANEVGMAKASIHHHLSTMEDHGYVTNKGGTYRLGLEFFNIGMQVRNRFQIYHAAKESLAELGKETGEAAWCFVEEGGRGMFLGGNAEHSTLNEDAVVGSWSYLHCSATGKAILAHLPASAVDDIIEHHGLPAMTPHTITDRSTLDEDLAEVREQGFALNLKEDLESIHAVGVPILIGTDVVGAIGVGGAANRLPREYCETRIAPAALTAVNEVQLKLAYQ